MIRRNPKTRGFTLVELIVVAGIIAVMVAVSLPNIIGFVRSSRIRAAEDMVASALQQARIAGIMKNTQMGVSLVVQSDQRFWVHVEDTVAGVTAGSVGFTRQGIDFAAPNSILDTRYDLPRGIVFGSLAADCPVIAGVVAFAPNFAAVRFDRYGMTTFPGKVMPIPPNVPDIVLNGGSATVNRIHDTGIDLTICVIDRQTDLRRMIQVSPAGRVLRH